MSYADTTDYDGRYLFHELSKDPEVLAAMGLLPGVDYSHAPGFREIRSAITSPDGYLPPETHQLMQAKIYLRCKRDGVAYVPLQWHDTETQAEYDKRIEWEAKLPQRLEASRTLNELFKTVYSAKLNY